MRALIASLALLPASAMAQQLVPVTLSPQEYQQILNELARRDPIMNMLIQKQEQAQQKDAQQKPGPPKPNGAPR